MNIVKGKLRAIRDHVIVHEMKFDQKISKGGILLLDDDGKDQGIRPRWGKVYAIGPEQKEVEVGQWILVAHGRWTRGVELQESEEEESKTLRRVDVNDILAVSDEAPADHEK